MIMKKQNQNSKRYQKEKLQEKQKEKQSPYPLFEGRERLYDGFKRGIFLSAPSKGAVSLDEIAHVASVSNRSRAGMFAPRPTDVVDVANVSDCEASEHLHLKILTPKQILSKITNSTCTRKSW